MRCCCNVFVCKHCNGVGGHGSCTRDCCCRRCHRGYYCGLLHPRPSHSREISVLAFGCRRREEVASVLFRSLNAPEMHSRSCGSLPPSARTTRPSWDSWILHSLPLSRKSRSPFALVKGMGGPPGMPPMGWQGGPGGPGMGRGMGPRPGMGGGSLSMGMGGEGSRATRGVPLLL